MSGKFTFKTAEGKEFTAIARDADRARCIAKKQALAEGASWTKARLVKFSNN